MKKLLNFMKRFFGRKKANKIEVEKQVKIEAKKQTKIEPEKQAKIEAEKQFKIEAEKQFKIETKAKKDAEAKAQKVAEAKAKKEAELKAKIEAEKQAMIEAERQAKIEAKTKKVAEAKAKKDAELKAKMEAEKQAKIETEKQAKIEAEKQAKIEAEKQAKIEAEKLLNDRVKEEFATKVVANVDKANIDEELKNIFSEWNYGISNGRTYLTLKTMDPKHINYTLDIIKSLPKTPAIYLYKEGDEVVYVGKTINLKKRTCEHFFDGNGGDKVDEFLRENPTKFKISFMDCEPEELSNWEKREISKYNPKYNYNTGGGKITAKYTRTIATKSEIGNIVDSIVADGMVFTVSGRFYDDMGSEINRTVVSSIVKELGGIYSPKGSLKTELTIAGSKPGKKAKVGRADRKAVIHPFDIIGFQEKYDERG